MPLTLCQHAQAPSTLSQHRRATFIGRQAVRCNTLTSREASCLQVQRRQALTQQAFVLAGLFTAGPAAAICADLDTAEAGDACRQAELARDRQGDYGALSNTGAKKMAPNVPVGDLNDEYTRSTRDLANKIGQYITKDVYDKARQPLIKSLKTDGLAWVSKYARGGSARTQSARNMYIAVDAVQGHLASNGLAPLPSMKAKVITQTVGKALTYLDEGK